MDHSEAISLTTLEREIIGLIAQGRSAKEIARTVALSPRTIERHIELCRHRIGARNNAHLVAAVLASSPQTAWEDDLFRAARPSSQASTFCLTMPL
jgi:DNA-binding CsgD family transcriptional regulator